MEGPDELLDSLKEEADILRRKHQRKGVEYKVRHMAMRPSITRGEPGDSTSRKAAMSPLTARPVTAPADTGLTLPSIRGAMSAAAGLPAASGGGGGGAGGALVLEDYDPKRQQEAEAERLSVELTRLREQASQLHHAMGALGRQREGLEHELEQLAHADGVERDRAEGLRAVERTKEEVARLEAQGGEADAYRDTLEFVLHRCRRERVETLAMQKVSGALRAEGAAATAAPCPAGCMARGVFGGEGTSVAEDAVVAPGLCDAATVRTD
jgi:hypothetical protein